MTYIETIVPAIQAEQVADDVAPVTAEYVPAKASDEEYGHVDLNISVSVTITKEEGEKMEADFSTRDTGRGAGGRKDKEKSYGVEQEKRGNEEGRRRAWKNKNKFPAMSRTPRPPPQSMKYGDKTTCDTSGAGRG